MGDYKAGEYICSMWEVCAKGRVLLCANAGHGRALGFASASIFTVLKKFDFYSDRPKE